MTTWQRLYFTLLHQVQVQVCQMKMVIRFSVRYIHAQLLKINFIDQDKMQNGAN